MPGEFLWDVVGPGRPVRTPGVVMAGFADRGRNPAGLRLIPHPAVTVALMFGPAEVVMVDAGGRERRGSLVAGTGWQGAVGMRRATGMRCVQVRLSPTVARGILGVAPSELGGELVSPGDLWGRTVGELGERLAGATGWDERFALVDDWLGRRPERRPIDREVAWRGGGSTRAVAWSGSRKSPARSGGAANGCGHVFTTSSGCRPSERPGWSASTGRPIDWPRGTVRRGSRPTAAMPTSRICTGTSWPSPVRLRPRSRGNRSSPSTTWRGQVTSDAGRRTGYDCFA